jgi:hypothetical protein
MKTLGLAVALALVAVAAAGCVGAHYGPPEGVQPTKRLVDRAASMAFGTHSTCTGPGQYQDYTCLDHPSVCGVLTDTPNGCWETECDVMSGVRTRTGDVADFYYCERFVPSCSSVTGGCPSDGTCIVGHGRSLRVDATRTAELPVKPDSTSAEFSCPYPGEG